jgi:mono/diheme cytochrome c family protein
MKNKIFPRLRRWLLPVALGFAFGCQSHPPFATQQAGLPKEKVDARGIFFENCATCHGTDGRARTFHGRILFARNLTNPLWQTTTTDAEIASAIRMGPKAMPAFGKKLSPAEIEALVSYVRTFKPAP